MSGGSVYMEPAPELTTAKPQSQEEKARLKKGLSASRAAATEPGPKVRIEDTASKPVEFKLQNITTKSPGRVQAEQMLAAAVSIDHKPRQRMDDHIALAEQLVQMAKDMCLENQPMRVLH